jgi:hypothetical protein
MSSFNLFSHARYDFDNGFTVSCDPAIGMGTLFCGINCNGKPVDIGHYLTKPGKNDGFTALITPEAFAEILYRVSKEEKIHATP